MFTPSTKDIKLETFYQTNLTNPLMKSKGCGVNRRENRKLPIECLLRKWLTVAINTIVWILFKLSLWSITI